MREIFTRCCLAALLLLSVVGFAQDKTLKGRVTSRSDGSGLPGANVLIKGTDRGSTTNANGEFTISTPPNAVLIVSFIGFKSTEVPVGTKSFIELSLEEDASNLTEIVV
uniref:carboxypeptidase-like regulatory domain-containing protein n=1 Tax=Spirosoma sp. TaxID=1899569 RepID=UPI003B3A0FD8